MGFAKPIFLAVVAMLLAVYAFDCDGITTPEQAMQCCDSMPCSSLGHHGQDCCKTMPEMHSPFTQPSSVHDPGVALGLLAVLFAFAEPVGLDGSVRRVSAYCHAPPLFRPPSAQPLRI
jgi:hypothetical protein